MPEMEDRANAVYDGATWISRNKGFISMCTGFGAVVIAIIVTCVIVVRWADGVVHSNDLRLQAIESVQASQTEIQDEQASIIQSIREEQIRRSNEFDDIRRLWDHFRELETRLRAVETQAGMTAEEHRFTSMPSVDGTIDDYVDVLELNRYYDEVGRLLHTQVIGWSFDEGHDKSRLNVVFWRLAKVVSDYPVPQGSYYVTTYRDGDAMRKVYGRSYRETWTQYDPEMEDRNNLPMNQRRGLTPATEPEKDQAA